MRDQPRAGLRIATTCLVEVTSVGCDIQGNPIAAQAEWFFVRVQHRDGVFVPVPVPVPTCRHRLRRGRSVRTQFTGPRPAQRENYERRQTAARRPGTNSSGMCG
ncbi:hypothetical protein [Prescottella equi]|uniref:hypothetical protein n=1 Tax=Rhodococcus hoagii TaxID=43767 RepID=UPI003AF32873